MSVIVAIRAKLLADAQVASLIGTRAYAKKIPQGVAYPVLTVELINSRPENTLTAPGTLKNARVRINAWGRTYAETEHLALAVEDALNSQSGIYSGIHLASIVALGLRDFYEPAIEAYYHTQDFSVYYH